MDPKKAEAYYDELKAKGAAAAQFKRGLGYKPETQETVTVRPVQSVAPVFQPRPMMPYPIYYPQPSAFPRGYGVVPAFQRPVASPNASSWTAHRSGDSVYYYNSVTGVSQWQCPPELMGSLGQPTETPKPIASERIPNTTWTEVKCEDGRVYYYNMVTKAAVWTVPPEVVQSRQPSAAPLQPTPAPTIAPEGPMPEIKRGRKATPAEIQVFKELLHDSGVTAFARYEKEATELNEHPSWQGIALEKERRTLFDAFIRERAQEERQAKRPSHADAKTAFEALLMEAREEEMKQHPDTPFISTLFGGAPSIARLQEIYQTDARWVDCPADIREQSFKAFCRRYPFEAPSHSEDCPKGEPEPSLTARLKRSCSRSLSPPKEESSAAPLTEGRVDPREGSSAEKQKRARVEQEIKESQRRLRRASHATAVSDYRTLLSELIKQPHVSWESMADRITSDIQGRGRSRCMDDRERERLFHEHLDKLYDTAVRDYEQVLREKLGNRPEEDTEAESALYQAWESYEAAEKLLNLDPHTLQPSHDIKYYLEPWRGL